MDGQLARPIDFVLLFIYFFVFPHSNILSGRDFLIALYPYPSELDPLEAKGMHERDMSGFMEEDNDCECQDLTSL